jgi:hypothetical protein
MCAMHRIRMLHNQAYTRYSFLCIPYLVYSLLLCAPHYQELQPLFIDKHVSCKAHPWSSIFKDIVGHFLPHDLHDLSGLFSSKWWGMIPRSQQLGEPNYAPTFCPHDAATSPTFCPHKAATSPPFCLSTRQSQLPVLLRQLLSHLYALDSPSSKF